MQTGYLFILQGEEISWSTRRQRTVALSSTEAEYMSGVYLVTTRIDLRTTRAVNNLLR